MIDGIPASSSVRFLRKKESGPLLKYSPTKMEIDREKGLAAGADEYITKPFSPQAVVDKVREMLGES